MSMQTTALFSRAADVFVGVFAQSGTTPPATNPTPTLGSGAGTASAASTAADQGHSLWQYILGGGVIGYVIITLSVLAVALAIAHLIQVRRSRFAPPEVVASLETLLRSGEVHAALEFCRRPDSTSFVANVFAQALTRCLASPFGLLELRSALEDAGQREVERAVRTTDGLAILAAIGPMLGLLGTVFGMIGAFATVGKLEGAARSTELAMFMSLALITTAQGLVLAIPCTIAYSWFRRRTERLSQEAAELIERLASLMNQNASPATRGVGSAQAPRPVARAVQSVGA